VDCGLTTLERKTDLSGHSFRRPGCGT